MSAPKIFSLAPLLCLFAPLTSPADENVRILDVPDYAWYAGCFGSATGNMMGFWDRNGFPDFYTGPTAEGVAPLNSNGTNVGIRSLWASKAGFDGRPADQPGHIDDYWQYFNNDNSYSYESTEPDPYVLAGRPEHAPECTGDFIGASQNKWSYLDGECNGNIDAFSFNFWDKQGLRRHNFVPPDQGGVPMRDVQSGLRKWAQARGYEASVFSQQVDFNKNIPAGTGFTFQDLKAEIDAGYPLMLFLQNPTYYNRDLAGMADANPIVHGMIAFGYVDTPTVKAVRYRTSWASGDNRVATWANGPWEASLTLRGVIGFHPVPKIRSVARKTDGVHIQWDGPSANVYDSINVTINPAHWYVVEKLDALDGSAATAVTTPSTNRDAIVPATSATQAYFRIKVLKRSELPQ